MRLDNTYEAGGLYIGLCHCYIVIQYEMISFIPVNMILKMLSVHTLFISNSQFRHIMASKK